jgi:hypothetical protein
MINKQKHNKNKIEKRPCSSSLMSLYLKEGNSSLTSHSHKLRINNQIGP